jgi:uncharacterized membrane protein YoaK (UPF0700 family)
MGGRSIRGISLAARDNTTLLLLAFASATTDIFAFLGLGRVFTSAMTGNAALLGVSLGQGRLAAASRAVAALLGFLVGAIGATLLGHLRWTGAVKAALGFEVLCLALFAVIWLSLGERQEASYPLIVLSAIGMGAQSVGARRINLPALPTVVFTTTLTSICISVTEALLRRQPIPADAIRQMATFLAYLIGAVLAGVLGAESLASIALLPLVAVTIALALQFDEGNR